MGDRREYYKVRFAKWHFFKCVWKHFSTTTENYLMKNDYKTYDEALDAINKDDAEKKKNKKIEKEVFIIQRTVIPSHIPPEQRQQYTTTLKEKGV
jgi:hypothetical protein